MYTPPIYGGYYNPGVYAPPTVVIGGYTSGFSSGSYYGGFGHSYGGGYGGRSYGYGSYGGFGHSYGGYGHHHHR